MTSLDDKHSDPQVKVQPSAAHHVDVLVSDHPCLVVTMPDSGGLE